jgi:signal transduction histidine kinase
VRSLRNQILIPIVAVQAVAVATLAVTAATLAARRSERQIIGRLNEVIAALGHSNFPFTQNVLTRMHGLSGAHFAVCGDDGRVTDATLPALTALPPLNAFARTWEGEPPGEPQHQPARTSAAADRPPGITQSHWVASSRPMTSLDSLGNSPTLLVDGIRYLVVRLASSPGRKQPPLLVLYPETSWRQARWEAAAPPLAVGLGTLVLMATVTSWIAQRISVRIQRLQEQVARIAAGDFEPFDGRYAGDEVQGLAESINLMSAQLKGMQETIRQSERTRLLAQFAAGLAHQLRNSLTGARMSIQLHVKRFPPRAGDETLNVALRQLAITEEQVKGLLSLGRSERAPRAPCELGRLLGDVSLLVHPSCQHSKVHLYYQRGDKAVRVMADEARLRGAVLNLAMNAIEAAGPGGEVGLGVSCGPGGVVIEVNDNGPGPPPEVANTLFEPFITSKPEGVGLGLALAHHVALEHEGRLSWVRDGDRTRFHLILPDYNGTAEECR